MTTAVAGRSPSFAASAIGNEALAASAGTSVSAVTLTGPEPVLVTSTNRLDDAFGATESERNSTAAGCSSISPTAPTLKPPSSPHASAAQAKAAQRVREVAGGRRFEPPGWGTRDGCANMVRR